MIDVLDVVEPRTLAELWRTWARVRTKKLFCAGCTDLLVLAKDGHIPPATWFDLSRIDEIKRIEAGGSAIWIGAGVTYARILDSALLARHALALVDCARAFGSPQIRTAATLGGNCANGSPAGDGIPPLFALGATVELRRGSRRRHVAIEQFFRGVRKTVLRPGEIIAGFAIPKTTAPSVFLKLGTREAMAISKVSVAMRAEPRRGRLTGVRIALGAVAPTVVRARGTEMLLEGRALGEIDDDLLGRARDRVRTEVSPISDYRSTAEYRREQSGFLVQRAARRIAGRSGEP